MRGLGKGLKEWHVPLRKDAAFGLRAWSVQRCGEPDDRVSLNRLSWSLAHDFLHNLLAMHLATARMECPSTKAKCVPSRSSRHKSARRSWKAESTGRTSRRFLSMIPWKPRMAACTRIPRFAMPWALP